MSRWEDQFKEHAIHVTLTEIINLIDVEFEEPNAASVLEKRRLLKVIAAYQDVLEQIDPEITPFNLLDNLNTSLRDQNFWNQINAYNSDGQPKHLTRANNHLNNNIGQLSQLLAIAKKAKTEKPLRGLQKTVDDFAKSVEEKQKNLEEKISTAKSTADNQAQQLANLDAAVKAKKQETDNLINSWQEQFSNAQNARSEEFSNDQKTRTAEHNQWKKQTETEATKQIQALLEENKDKLQAFRNSYEDDINSYIATAEEKHAAILELYELVAGDSVASGYLQNAEDEKKQANFWRWAAIVFIVLTAAWTGVSYFIGTTVADDGGILWGQVIKAFSVTGVLLFGAGYSAKQSNTHRQNEKKTRWFALEVKAIDPFIASLNEDDRKALKNKLSEKLFGRSDSENKDDHNIVDEHAFSMIIKGITDVLKAR
jgi:hypothetical protein